MTRAQCYRAPILAGSMGLFILLSPTPVIWASPPPAPIGLDAGLERAAARIRGQLQPEAARLDKPIKGDAPAVGPVGTRIVRARIDGAYPGTGVATILVTADGDSWGKRGERDVADLMRRLGWLKTAPAAKTFMAVLNQAEYDGMLLWNAETVRIELQRSDPSLHVAFERRAAFGPQRSPMKMRLKGAGELISEHRPLAETQPARATPTEALKAALASDQALAIGTAITRLRGTTDPAGRALLAQTSTLANDTLAVAALDAVGTTDGAVTALRKAWSGLDSKRKAQLVAFATELHGPAFAAKLKSR